MRAETEEDAGAFLIGFLVVRGAEDRVGRAVGADRRLDDVRDEPLVGDVVEVLELLPRELGVPAEVVIGAVVDALELVPSEGERELYVRRRGGVVGALVLGVITETELVLRDALLQMPGEAGLLSPLPENRGVGRGGGIPPAHLLRLPPT